MGLFGDLFGDGGVKNQKKEMQRANDFLQEGIAQLVRNLTEAGTVGADWGQKTLGELVKEYERRRADYTTGAGEAQRLLEAGYGKAAEGERERYAQQLGLAERGIEMDRSTLQRFLDQTLSATGPANAAYQQMISASLPALLGQMAGTSRLPISSAAQIGLEDTSRQERAAMQRQGLEGSGMAAARDAAARRRVLAEDEQNQWNRYMAMLTQGLGGTGQQASQLLPYAQMMGGLGGRLQQVTPTNLGALYERLATGQSNLASSLGTTLGNLQSGVPQQTQAMGQDAVQSLYNIANARFMAPQASSQFAANMSSIQPPGTLSKIGSLASSLSSLGSLFGGGGSGAIFSGLFGGGKRGEDPTASYGYFGPKGSWSNP